MSEEKDMNQDINVLLVDDDEMSRDIFEILLQGSDVNVDKADGGEMALVLTSQKKYDIILIDHMMPEMDGIETLHNIRMMLENKNQKTPVIALTANVKKDALTYYMGEGFDGYLSKPVNLEELEEVICKLLAKENESMSANCAELSNEAEKINDVDAFSGEKLQNEAFQSIPPVEDFNWESALTYNLNIENLKRLLKKFTGKLPRLIEEFSNFEFDVLEDDADIESLLSDYCIKVHSLKGNLKSFGNEKLSEYAMELEKASQNGDLKEVLEKTPAFCQRLRKCYERLLELVNKF